MNVVSSLKSFLPAPAKGFLKKLSMNLQDRADADQRQRDMIPPRTLNFVGNGDFKAVGDEFLRLFVQYGGLKPTDRVLDVGSGIGRMARPLTGYLTSGQYEGFDIVRSAVEWCQSNISPRYPNFHFSHTDILNRYYNPCGVYKSSEYKFPLEPNSFDFVFLTSVFTHMFRPDLEQYLDEIIRVLSPGRTAFITMFLLNEESERFILEGASTQNFIHKLDGAYTASLENPEGALAFPESYVRTLFQKRGLLIQDPVQYGSWCGRSKYVSYQDLIIAKKA